MGQASQKKQRIAALRHLCAGPGGFLEPKGAIALLSRTDEETLIRFRSAIHDLIPNTRLYALMDNIGQPALDQSGWIFVAHVWGGWTTLKLISKKENAITFIVDEYGEGFAARRLRWSTLVFGTDRDVASLLAATFRFREDLPEDEEPIPKPILAISHESESKLLIEIYRADVEAMNLAPALLMLDTFASNEEVLDRFGGAVVFSFSGFDDDPRFLGEIPSVNLYLKQLAIFAPWAPLISHPSCFLLWCKPLDERCVVKTIDSIARVQFPEGVGGRAILELLTYSAAELMSERLMISGVPSRLVRSIDAWSQFIATGFVEGYLPAEYNQGLEEADAETLLAQQTPASSEKEFWESLAATFAPGWNADVIDPKNDRPYFSGAGVFIYILDTKTGWMVAAGLPIVEMQHLLARIQQEPAMIENAPSLAIKMIRCLGGKGAKVSDQDNRLAILSTAAALASTQILRQVLERSGSPSGQYLYMVYSPSVGDPFGRPAYLEADAARILPLETVYGIAAEAIHSDITNPGSAVGGYIRNHGGLALCPLLQDLINGTPSEPGTL